MDKGY